MKNDLILDHYCNEEPICDNCPFKKFVPICGKGWHIVMDGNAKQQEAATLIFIAARMLKEDEPHYEK